MNEQETSNEATDIENREPSRVGLTDLLGDSPAEPRWTTKTWSVGEIIRIRSAVGGFRVWRVIGVFLGCTHQEDVVELETLDKLKNTEGRMCVPAALLHAAWAMTVE